MAELEIRLLGSPQVVYNQKILTFASRKALALVAYFATTQTSHQREALLSLLWPELDNSRGRNALRYTLSVLRKTLPVPFLQSQGQLLSLVEQADVWVDLLAFEEAAAGDDPAQWQTAVSLYRGDFLTGFGLRDSIPFDEWQAEQTTEHREQVAKLLQKLLRHEQETGALETAVSYAQRWLALDPLQEQAHCHLMQLYAQLGRWADVHRQYQSCVQQLEAELGVEPMPQTTAVYEQLQATMPTAVLPATLPAPPTYTLPQPATSFIGRTADLATLATLLAEPQTRLVTILGGGGMGKTRLALQTAVQQQDDFPNGVVFVPLAASQSSNGVVGALANALQLRFHDGQEPLQQLLTHLQQRQLLLVLDNVEQLLGSQAAELGQLLTTLLESGTRLKLLVTSRERLRLPQEHVHLLRGLPLADETAVSLFYQRAQQIRPLADSLDHNAVRAICQLVEGMPLAIELAAALSDHLTFPEIFDEIRRSLDILTSNLHGLPARQQSIRAVFDTSWQSLSDAEQTTLAQLSHFRGGFTRYAAQATIPQLTLTTLSKLVGKSLLRPQENGRYTIHELLRQYASEKLTTQPSLAQETEQRHADFFANRLQAFVEKWQTRHKTAVFTRLLPDIDNIHQAWAFYFAQGPSEVLTTFSDNLWQFYRASGRFSEAISLFQQLLPQASTPWPRVAWEAGLGEACYGAGQLDESIRYFHQALNTAGEPLPTQPTRLLLHALQDHLSLRQFAQSPELTRCLTAVYDRLTQITYLHNKFGDAALAIWRGHQHASRLPNGPALAISHANQAVLWGTLQQARRATRHWRQAQQLVAQCDDLSAQARVALRSCVYLATVGELEAARLAAEEAIAHFRQLEDYRNWGDSLMLVTTVTGFQGHFAAAEAHGLDLLALAQTSRNQEHEAWAKISLALVALYTNRLEQAQTHLQTAVPTGSSPLIFLMQATRQAALAMVSLRQGGTETAVAHANAALEQLSSQFPTSVGLLISYDMVAHVLLTVWEKTGKMPSQLSAALRALTRFGRFYRVGKPYVCLHQGHAWYLQGRLPKARRAWTKGLDLAETLMMPYMKGRLLLENGRFFPKSSTALAEARQLFTQLGTTWELELCQQPMKEYVG